MEELQRENYTERIIQRQLHIENYIEEITVRISDDKNYIKTQKSTRRALYEKMNWGTKWWKQSKGWYLQKDIHESMDKREKDTEKKQKKKKTGNVIYKETWKRK